MRILLIEDHRELSDWLARSLARERYAVECVYDGLDAHRRLSEGGYDIVVLDLELPGMAGEEVLRRLRAHDRETPVLVLTAKSTLGDRVQSLDSGADDYLVKPFEVAELEARLRVLLRRRYGQKTPVISCGGLSLDTNTRLFQVDGKALLLTPREHAVLEALLVNMGKTVSKKALADKLFTLDELTSPDAIEVYVHRLRRKMEGCDATIVTLRGLGYLLRHEAA